MAVEISKKDVLDVNETDESSARAYLADLAAVGIDVDSLSFVEIVSVTRKCHGRWQRSDARRAELAAAELAREAAAKADRLAALAKRRDSLLAADAKAAKAAERREAALAELREAGLLD